MPIQCNEINQTINYLLTAFEDCKKIDPEDLRTMVELIAAVNTCSNGGTEYNCTINEVYEPLVDEEVVLEPYTFHAISIVVSEGTLFYNDGLYPQGSTINLEFTNLNQQFFYFTPKAGSKILVEMIVECNPPG